MPLKSTLIGTHLCCYNVITFHLQGASSSPFHTLVVAIHKHPAHCCHYALRSNYSPPGCAEIQSVINNTSYVTLIRNVVVQITISSGDEVSLPLHLTHNTQWVLWQIRTILWLITIHNLKKSVQLSTYVSRFEKRGNFAHFPKFQL